MKKRINLNTRLSNDKYVKKGPSFQEQLTKEEIDEYLIGHEKVVADQLYLNDTVRYYAKQEDGKYLFRLGGSVKNINLELGYVVLSNGWKTWSVQIPTSKFYKKLTDKEIYDMHTEQITEKEQEINSLREKLVKTRKLLTESTKSNTETSTINKRENTEKEKQRVIKEFNENMEFENKMKLERKESKTEKLKINLDGSVPVKKEQNDDKMIIKINTLRKNLFS